MDQSFEGDVMEALAAETPISSADAYNAMEEEGFDTFADNDAFSEGTDEFAVEDLASFEEDSLGDNLEGELWDDYGELGDEFQAHHPNRRNPNPRSQQRQSRNTFSNELFLEEEDGFDDEFDNSFEDDFAPRDSFSESQSVDALDAMEAAIADALEAEDSDEFLRRVAQGVRRAATIARQVGRGVGQVARVVGPVASLIPLPQAQAIGAIANIAGRLLADGADEFEALDQMLAFAEEEDALDAAAPVIAGLTVRTIMPRAARFNRTTRRQLVHSVRQSTQNLGRRQGVQAARAVPRVVQAVERTAQRRRVPPQQLPQAVRRATATVARNPRLVSQLARATQHASTVTHRYSSGVSSLGKSQRLIIRGPVEITITSR